MNSLTSCVVVMMALFAAPAGAKAPPLPGDPTQQLTDLNGAWREAVPLGTNRVLCATLVFTGKDVTVRLCEQVYHGTFTIVRDQVCSEIVLDVKTPEGNRVQIRAKWRMEGERLVMSIDPNLTRPFDVAVAAFTPLIIATKVDTEMWLGLAPIVLTLEKTKN